MQISSSTVGKCHSAGSTYPTSGQVVGRVLSTNVGAGTYDVLLTPGVKAGGGGVGTANNGEVLYDNAGAVGGIATTGTGSVVRAGSPTIITPTVASFVNATHSHQNAAGGGALDAAAVSSGQLAAARGGLGVDASGCTGAFLWASGTPTCTSTTGTGSFVRAAAPTFAGDILPDGNGTRNFGATGTRWASGYFNASVYATVSVRVGLNDQNMLDVDRLILRSSNYIGWSNSSVGAGSGSLDAGLARCAQNVVCSNGGSGTTAAGALQATGASRPTCNSTARGAIWTTQSAAGVGDIFQVCMKGTGDTYAWRDVFTAP